MCPYGGKREQCKYVATAVPAGRSAKAPLIPGPPTLPARLPILPPFFLPSLSLSFPTPILPFPNFSFPGFSTTCATATGVGTTGTIASDAPPCDNILTIPAYPKDDAISIAVLPFPVLISVSAPLFTNTSTASAWPASTAQCSAVYPSSSFASTAAPLSIKTFITSTLPLNPALINAVHPHPSLPSTAAPISIALTAFPPSPFLAAAANPSPSLNNPNSLACPSSAARSYAVFPAEFLASFNPAHPFSIRILTVASSPIAAATCSAVLPVAPPRASPHAPAASNAATQSRRRSSAARCSGVRPSAATTSGAAPFRSRIWRTSKCPPTAAWCNGDQEDPDELRVEAPRARRSSAIRASPIAAADSSGDRPARLRVSTLAPNSSISWTKSARLRAMARWSRVFPWASAESAECHSGSLASRTSRTFSMSPSATKRERIEDPTKKTRRAESEKTCFFFAVNQSAGTDSSEENAAPSLTEAPGATTESRKKVSSESGAHSGRIGAGGGGGRYVISTVSVASGAMIPVWGRIENRARFSGRSRNATGIVYITLRRVSEP
ncbi:hypothetical protein M5K25_002633 [Dendrobium thyrsiflorum]|uniref:Uncharacterized protein n=1 Tax=Dendrobium thyrsiflorum TaxID=117978 RepID=A0ABD0VNQ7_DENTH